MPVLLPKLGRLAAAVTLLLLFTLPGYSEDWIVTYQRRATRFTLDQPRWAGPVFTPNPLLLSVFREDFSRSRASAGDQVRSLGFNKGLQFVPFPRTEFTVIVPPFLKHSNGTADGFGDFTTSVKVELLRSPEQRRNYVFSAVLNGIVPTGSYSNGAPDAIVGPQLGGGKGYGRWNVAANLGATLPVANAKRNGRVLTGNSIVQYHAARYLWTQFETSTSTWFGSARDGEVQSFVAPALVFGRLPYRPNEQDRRRGMSIGVGFQSAVTHFHTYNHALVFTTRFHF